ncbi:hypothetical protein [Nocardiopsis alba]|uniref:hypothetical protein n=1 Tax=Nocardiopsis alba TaxID=53437 RepID=UPI0035E202BB
MSRTDLDTMRPLHPHAPPSAGPHHLLAHLGEDAETRSYLGRSPDKAPVRVVIPRSGSATVPSIRSAFVHRVKSAFGSKDPYVASIVDADFDSPVPWAAIERPLGPNLADLVRNHGPLPTAALHPLALATARGLAALHSARRAHGSLAPENVLIGEDGALLADPGLTSTANDAAPADDVLSWASVLCFASSGAPGTEGLDEVPLQLRGMIDACLHEDADLRPGAADLVNMLGGTTSSTAWPPEQIPVIETFADAMRRLLPDDPPSPAPGGRGRFLGMTAAALALTLVVASGAVWGNDRVLSALGGEGSAEGETEDAPGLITEAACADGNGLPEAEADLGDLPATAAVFSPDGDVLAVTGGEHGLGLWDWRNNEPIAHPTEEGAVISDPVFSPVGCMLAAVRMEEVEEETRYRLATTYDLPSGEILDHLGALPEPRPDGSRRLVPVSSVDFSPDGRWMAVGTSTEYQLVRDHSIGLVDLATGETVRTFNDEEATGDLAFLDATRLAAYGSGIVTVWDVETGERLETIRNVQGGAITTIPDRNQIVYVGNGRLVWRDLTDGSDIATFLMEDYSESVFTPDLRSIAADADRGLVHVSWVQTTDEEDPDDRETILRAHLWEVESGEDLLAGNEDAMARGAAFHPEVIAGVDREGRVVIMDPDTLEVVETLG